MSKNQNIDVIYEDNHLIAINKRSGDLVHDDETGDLTLLEKVKEYIKVKYNKPGAVFLAAVHRLDRPVSGVVVFARTSKALERMNALFKDREMTKVYWAIVLDYPQESEQTLVHYIKKDTEKNKSRAYLQEVKESKRAELSFSLLSVIGDHSMLEVRPITGRPHQIRVQLSEIQHPIRGDVKYGYPGGNKDGSIHLHARSLSFIHPTQKVPVRIVAKAPDEQMWRLFTKSLN